MSVTALFKEYIWLTNVIYNAYRLIFAQNHGKQLDAEMFYWMKLARSNDIHHKDVIQDLDINIERDIERDSKDGHER